MKIAIVDDDAQDTDRLAAFLAEWSEEHHLDFSVTVFHKKHSPWSVPAPHRSESDSLLHPETRILH